ncbi:MAG: hypothetical protein HC866_13145 [Leptolyngbyaceae cyanobacterium RU_5_1]|nr:hypothetical protein [Leptolyngbyaceae cyanobacterium RU_5_1]
MQDTTYLELEREISRVVMAIVGQNLGIGRDLISSLQDRYTPEDVAGILLLSLERIVWLDANAFVWAVEKLMSEDMLRGIRQITSATIGKRLVDKGLAPGQDFSVDSAGKLLLNAKAMAVVFS